MLNDRKITDWTQPVSSLDDRPQMTAAALKAAFDSNTNQIKPAVNGMIDDLTGTGGAGNIGVDAIAGVTGTTVQAMLAALKALIDLCDTSETVDDKLDLKADKTTTDKLVKTITLNADTGVFTIQTDDGTTTTIDTMLEKIPVNCYLDGQEFVLVLDDGTEQRADLSDFITETEFTDSSTIDFSVTGSNVTATIKNGSVTLAMLESTVITTLQGYMTAAQTAAANAATSETNAGQYRDQAQGSATAAATSASEADLHATESESWAIGGTGTRQGEDTNNSKYFAQQSANSAATAQGWSDSAMEQADAAAQSAADAAQSAADAEAIAGGDYIPNSQKGVAGGVATLGSDGKVSSTQLPEMNYIPASQKGAASGVASLDATGKLEETQKPDYTASEVGAVPTTRTVNGKALSADVTLTGEDIKTSASDNTPIGDVVSVLGGATTPQAALANLGAGVRPNLLDNAIFIGGGSQQGGGQFPINQRGKTSYIGTAQGIDRWKSTNSNLTVQIQNDCLLLTSNDGGHGYFRQYKENEIPPGTYTLSALVKGSGGIFLNIASTTNSDSFTGLTEFTLTEDWALCVFTFEVTEDLDWSPQQFYIKVNKDSACYIKAFKAELGPTQTLASQDDTGAWQILPQPESDYATQLSKCQRYLYTAENITMCPGGVENENLIFGVHFPIEMRTDPVFIGADGGNNLQLFGEGITGFYENRIFSLQWCSKTGATIKCPSPISFPTDSAINGRIDQKLMFSAEM